jgi:multidrug efflux pump subunit AcrA (membrane-fusion protein)
VNRNIDIGQTVAASLQAPTLFTIAQDLTKMYVYAKTDEGDVGQIRPGHTADFQVDAFPKEVFHGVVSQVRMNATTVQNVVTYDTIVEFVNPDTKLFPGMTAYVSIPVASVSNVIKIPNAALRYKPYLPAEQVQALYSKGLPRRKPNSRRVRLTRQASSQVAERASMRRQAATAHRTRRWCGSCCPINHWSPSRFTSGSLTTHIRL